jgi:hypothetical protein
MWSIGKNTPSLRKDVKNCDGVGNSGEFPEVGGAEGLDTHVQIEDGVWLDRVGAEFPRAWGLDPAQKSIMPAVVSELAGPP